MSKDHGIDLGTATHTGYVREENQDHAGVFDTPRGRLLVLADGMGGERGGSLAAELTVQGLQQTLIREVNGRPPEESIRDAFEQANAALYQRAAAGETDTRGMGSTALIALLSGNRAWIAHVGDSRAYLLRGGRLMRLTRDHTRVQRMADVGILTEEEARVHPDGNILDRAMGHMPEVEVDIARHELLAQDLLLLCSDGLWAYSTETEIEQVLNRPGTAQQLCDQLIELALDKGGEDNVTVQLLRMTETPVAAAAGGRVTRELPEFNGDQAPPEKSGKRHHLHAGIAAVVLLLGLLFWTQWQPPHPPDDADPGVQLPAADSKPQPPTGSQPPPDSAAVKSEVGDRAGDGGKPLPPPEKQPTLPLQTTETEKSPVDTGDGSGKTIPASGVMDGASPQPTESKGEAAEGSRETPSASAGDPAE